jgi:hypothetical protein
VQLPVGLLNLFVQIFDDQEGITVYNLTDPVFVNEINATLTTLIVSDILYTNSSLSLIDAIKSENLLESVNQILSINSVIGQSSGIVADNVRLFYTL